LPSSTCLFCDPGLSVSLFWPLFWIRVIDSRRPGTSLYPSRLKRWRFWQSGRDTKCARELPWDPNLPLAAAYLWMGGNFTVSRSPAVLIMSSQNPRPGLWDGDGQLPCSCFCSMPDFIVCLAQRIRFRQRSTEHARSCANAWLPGLLGGVSWLFGMHLFLVCGLEQAGWAFTKNGSCPYFALGVVLLSGAKAIISDRKAGNGFSGCVGAVFIRNAAKTTQRIPFRNKCISRVGSPPREKMPGPKTRPEDSGSIRNARIPNLRFAICYFLGRGTVWRIEAP